MTVNHAVRKMTNDDIVRFVKHQHQKSIHFCSKRAAAAIVRRMPKSMARRIDKVVLAELIEAEFLSGFEGIVANRLVAR
jgi:hypothetical protein